MSSEIDIELRNMVLRTIQNIPEQPGDNLPVENFIYRERNYNRDEEPTNTKAYEEHRKVLGDLWD